MSDANEYVLQKKTLGGWSYVTWYDTLEQAKRNFDSCSKESGYSWRIVKLEVIEERLLNDPIEVKPDEDFEAPDKPVNSGWGKPTAAVNSSRGMPSPKSKHGLYGKVWLANRELKEKRRVDPSMVDAMLAQGWFKAGPRTVL